MMARKHLATSSKLNRQRAQSGLLPPACLGLLLSICLGPALVDCQSVSLNEDPDQAISLPMDAGANTTKSPLDHKTIGSQLCDQNKSKQIDAVIKVIGDTNDFKNDRRLRALELVEEQAKQRGIVYDDTIQSKRIGREFDFKMTVSTEGVSKTDEFYFWKVLHNDTTILVIRSINKYYYWDVSSCSAPPVGERPTTAARNNCH